MTYTFDLTQFVPWLASAFCGLVIWLVGLEWRFRNGSQRFRRIEGDIRYIRERIDRSLNSHSE